MQERALYIGAALSVISLAMLFYVGYRQPRHPQDNSSRDLLFWALVIGFIGMTFDIYSIFTGLQQQGVFG